MIWIKRNELSISRLLPDDGFSHRTLLSPKNREIYDRVAAAMAEGKTAVKLSDCSRVNASVVSAIKYDQPMLYYIDFTNFSQRIGPHWAELSWNPFWRPDEIRELDEEINRALEGIGKPEDRRPLIREAVIHDGLQDMGIRRTEDVPEERSQFHTILGPLMQKRSACEGIAQLFRLLCIRAGVHCRMIHGNAAPAQGAYGPHAWNQVRLENTMAHVDPTWDCFGRSPGFGYCYDYFNISDEEIRIDHNWDSAVFPEACGNRFSYFVLSGRVVSSPEEMRQLARKVMNQKKHSFCAKWTGSWTGQQMLDACTDVITGRISYMIQARQKIISVQIID